MNFIGDIMISRIMYDSDRFKTAQGIAMAIREYMRNQKIDNFFSDVKTIDIPTSTNRYDKTCLAFMRLANERDHQNFVDRFNSKIEFRGKNLILRLCSEGPKGWSAMYERDELAWSSYPRTTEPSRISQITNEPS